MGQSGAGQVGWSCWSAGEGRGEPGRVGQAVLGRAGGQPRLAGQELGRRVWQEGTVRAGLSCAGGKGRWGA